MASSTVSPLGAAKILFFDVFGTVVDWRSSITNFLVRECEAALSSSESALPDRARSMTVEDWGKFAQDWRDSYHTYTRTVAKLDPDANDSYANIDAHMPIALRELLVQWNLQGLWATDAEARRITQIWHALDGWPDSASGLRKLRRSLGYHTSTLSNGNVSLLTDMAAHADLDWTHVTSAEMFRSYKPNPAVYNGAAAKYGFQPNQCVLVAAHLNDLKAAKNCGWHAIYVERSREEEWDAARVEEVKKEGWVDMWVKIDEEGFEEVARRLAGIKGVA